MTTAEDRIVQLAEKVRRFKSEAMALSEQDTKAVLVEPLLELIGWDVHDPAQVRREDRPTDLPVDYSLRIGGRVKVLLECKRLADPLESGRALTQALTYTTEAGVRWCVLTNGCLFRIYNSLAPEAAEDKLLEAVDLSMVGETDVVSPGAAMQTLELISPQSIETGRIDEAWEERYTGTKIREVVKELWSKPDPGLVNLVRQRMMERGRTLSKKEIAQWLGTLDIKVGSTFTPSLENKEKEVKPEPTGPTPRPTRIRLGAYGDDIEYSYEILTKTAEWLIRQGKLRAADCPISTAGRRNIVNTEAKHRDGGDFRAPRRLSNGLWIDVNHSTAGCIAYARRLLKRFGYSEDMLEVE